MSETPKTDAAVERNHINSAMTEYVKASFARSLEKENRKLRSTMQEAANMIRRCDYTPARSLLLVALDSESSSREAAPTNPTND